MAVIKPWVVKATYGRKLVWAYATRETRVRGDREERQRLAGILARVRCCVAVSSKAVGKHRG